jgi:acetyl esterase/lipase
MRRAIQAFLLAAALTVTISGARAAALPPEVAWAISIQTHYQVTPDITYLTADNYESKLDVYRYRGDTKRPTVIYIHGGGWANGYTKNMFPGGFQAYLALGWNVVNVDYRPSGVALAPGAVEDCLCALRWVIRNAEKYGVDTNQIILTGASAGGHLALTTGMIPASAGLDARCPGTEPLKVAAIVDWFGITDVGDLLAGENRQTYAVSWVGAQANGAEAAKRSSPLTYVRPGLPPIIMVHGDNDKIVPYSHSVRLRDALLKAKVAVELKTIPGGGHGTFNPKETEEGYVAIFDFLAAHGISVKPPQSAAARP